MKRLILAILACLALYGCTSVVTVDVEDDATKAKTKATATKKAK